MDYSLLAGISRGEEDEVIIGIVDYMVCGVLESMKNNGRNPINSIQKDQELRGIFVAFTYIRSFRVGGWV